MKKINTLILALILTCSHINAQTTAVNFNMSDCSGKMHNLFSELDAGKVVIIEFFMLSCSACVDAGDALDPMFTRLKATCSNNINYYQFGFTNSYNCSQISNWVSSHNYTSVPIDSGAYQVGYYGGMGMPTIAVVAGKSHKVLYLCNGNTASFDVKDTTAISDSIRTFFNCKPTAIKNPTQNISSISILPSPASANLSLSFNSNNEGILQFSIVNLTGQKIMDFPKENIRSGIWNKTYELPSIPSGFYFIRGDLNGDSFTRKVSIQQE